MKSSKLLCLGMAVTLVCSNLPQMTVQTCGQTVKETATQLSENSVREDDGGTEDKMPISGGSDTATNGSREETVVEAENSTDADGFDIWYGELNKYSGNATEVVIPDGVTRIGRQAFFECKEITSVTIPDSVRIIEQEAFCGCSGLTSITIPDHVLYIGALAFGNCSGLTSITIPASVVSIGAMEPIPGIPDIKSSAFEGCSGLTSIKVEDGNTKYDSRDDCNAIIETESNVLIGGCKNTIIPSSVTRIEDWAFYDCNELTSITIPDSVTSIGKGAFYLCSRLTSITIPSSVTNLGESIFEGCSGLTSIIIPDSVTSIGEKAFKDCSRLTDITISSGVTRLEKYVFENCSGLTDITIPSSVKSIGEYAFKGCTGLEEVTIPSGVISIERGAFYDCSSLQSVIIPDSVTEIGSGVFAYCRGNMAIYGTENSYAQQYASSHGFTFFEGTPQTRTRFLSECQITVTPASVTYNGKAQTVDVSVKYGTDALKEGTDYTLVYSNNKRVGTATVTITGKGRYEGTETKNFTIRKGSQSLSIAKNKEICDKAYGDKSFNLGVKRKSGDGTLNYKTSDKKIAEVDANGKVTIKGTGSATITVWAAESANYNASPKIKITVNVSPAKQTLKSLKIAKGKNLTVSWEMDTKATGYEIQCSTDKKFKKDVKKITVKSNKTTSKKITKLKTGKKYYVKVRAYKTAKVNGKSQKLYGAWSSAKKSGGIKK